MSKKCFLCDSKKSVIDFNDNSFKICCLKLAFRKKQKFKYGNIELNKDPLGCIGYHSSCYNKVSVLKNKYKQEFENFVKNYDMLSTTPGSFNSSEGDENYTEDITISEDLNKMPSSSIASTSAGKGVCVFCNQIQKKSGKRDLNLIIPKSNETCQKIKNIASSLADHEFLSQLEHRHLAYHKPCYAYFLTKEKRRRENNSDSRWHTYRNLHKQAFESIVNFISNEIFENNRVMYLSQLFLRYQALLLKFGKSTIDLVDIENYRAEMLEKKLCKKFGDSLTIKASNGPRKQKIIYKTDIDVSVMANNIKLLENKKRRKN